MAKSKRKLERDREIATEIIESLPYLSKIFYIEPPDICMDDIVSCFSIKMLQIYSFCLQCISTTNLNEQIQNYIYSQSSKMFDHNSTLAHGNFNSKLISIGVQRIKFFKLVRAMLFLADIEDFTLQDLYDPQAKRTLSILKRLFEFIKIFVQNYMEQLEYKDRFDHLSSQLNLLTEMEQMKQSRITELKQEASDTSEAKHFLSQSIQHNKQLLKEEQEIYNKCTSELQSIEKSKLSKQDKLQEYKMQLTEKLLQVESKTALLVTSPDKLFQQRVSAESSVEVLMNEVNEKETQLKQLQSGQQAFEKLAKYSDLQSLITEVSQEGEILKQGQSNLSALQETQSSLLAESQQLFSQENQERRKLDNIRLRINNIEETKSRSKSRPSGSKERLETDIGLFEEELQNNKKDVEKLEGDIEFLQNHIKVSRQAHSVQMEKLNNLEEEIQNDITNAEEIMKDAVLSLKPS